MARIKVKGTVALAEALAAIATTTDTLESRADTILAIVKANGIRDAKAFRKAARAAYLENGWHARPGKPARGNGHKTPVPPTVKQYVSQVRAAFRFDLNVLAFKSFHALRKAVIEARLARKPKARGRRDPRLAGLKLIKGSELTGAVFHDAAVVYDGLDKARQAQMARAIVKVVEQFKAAAAPALELVKKAA
jgi:hypothetical protein